ncbi:hypothetical protein BS17DRAFT_845221 [Gyrodon lividus]|nr:hypothetical protein BS17DRAFT_845221 [Gyrodon lividus]
MLFSSPRLIILFLLLVMARPRSQPRAPPAFLLAAFTAINRIWYRKHASIVIRASNSSFSAEKVRYDFGDRAFGVRPDFFDVFDMVAKCGGSSGAWADRYFGDFVTVRVLKEAEQFRFKGFPFVGILKSALPHGFLLRGDARKERTRTFSDMVQVLIVGKKDTAVKEGDTVTCSQRVRLG